MIKLVKKKQKKNFKGLYMQIQNEITKYYTAY